MNDSELRIALKKYKNLISGTIINFPIFLEVFNDYWFYFYMSVIFASSTATITQW